jgi:hypothetical protein
MAVQRSEREFAAWLVQNLTWCGVVTLLVGLKLVLSYVVPGLKTPGELVLSGGLLLIYTVRIFHLRTAVKGRPAGDTTVRAG